MHYISQQMYHSRQIFSLLLLWQIHVDIDWGHKYTLFRVENDVFVFFRVLEIILLHNHNNDNGGHVCSLLKYLQYEQVLRSH